MWNVRLILMMSGVGLVVLGVSGKAQAQNLSPWPYTESCSTTGVSSACFEIDQTANNTSSYGIKGTATTGEGVVGMSTHGSGVAGSTTASGTGNAGVYGFSSGTASGIYGGNSSTGYAVYGQSGSGTAIYGTTNGIVAIEGVVSSGTGIGVMGSSSSGTGIDGTGVNGVYGSSNCGTGSTCIGVYGTSAGGNGVWGYTSSTTNAAVVGQAGNGNGIAFFGSGSILITGGASMPGGGPWAAASDVRIKKDVKNFDQGLAELMRVRPIRYRYNGLGGMADDGKEYAGVIAQELEKVMPTMVSARMGKLHASDAKDTAIKVVNPNEFTYLLIKAVQEQQKIIQSQESRLEALEGGKARVTSSKSIGVEMGLVIGLLPVGLMVSLRRRKKQS